MIELAEGSGNQYLVLLLVIGAMAVMMVTYRRNQRRMSRQPSPHEQINRFRQQHEISKSMNGLMVDLEEATRRMNAKLDTKFARLERVVEDADARIAKLEALKAEFTNLATKAAAEPTPSRKATPKPTTATARRPVAVSSRSQHIYDLADGGQTAINIAETLDMPLGEVELILRLRPEDH